MDAHDPLSRFVGPAVVCVRGPSRSGKTTVCTRLVSALSERGLRVGYAKRTHHLLDLPGKSSARVWSEAPAAMVIRSTDRLQLTLPPVGPASSDVLAGLPADLDLVLLETHEPEPYPTLLARCLEPETAETVVGRWSYETVDTDLTALVSQVTAAIPADRQLDHALRAARALHGSHLCAGLVLGTRLALAGAAALDLEVPDRKKRLVVAVETDRCAVDAIQAVTGCRPGKRTLRLRDYGKLAATFVDEHTGRAVRVAARPGLRAAVDVPAGEDRHAVQRLAYLAMTPDQLFTVTEVSAAVDQYDRPGPPRRRVDCVICGEEVSDGRDVATDAGPACRPCAAESRVVRPTEGVLA